MDLAFEAALATEYRNPAQRIRVLSEYWAANNIWCPCCGCPRLLGHSNNRPVHDFSCPECHEQFELKSHAQPKVRKIVDGAHDTMMKRLRAAGNPNLFLLQYDRAALRVWNLIVIPKYFLITPLSQPPEFWYKR